MKSWVKSYKCFKCNKVISPTNDYQCPYCNEIQPLENRANATGDEIVNIKCPTCGFDKSFYRKGDCFNSAYCAKCGETTYFDENSVKNLPVYKPKPTVTCPYCNSTNTKKISTISKAGNIALFGIFSLGKVSKQWHCNKCNSDF